MFVAAMVWVVSIMLCAIWCGYSFNQTRFRVIWPLKFLRLTARLSTTGLFIPLTSTMVSVFRCTGPGGTSNLGWECMSTPHVALIFAVGFFLVAFAVLSFIVVATFFDRDPTSTSFQARAHGRVHVGHLIIKLVLTIFFNYADQVHPWVLITFLLLSSVAWMFLFLYYLPFFSVRANQLEVAFTAVFAWATACLVLSEVHNGSKDAAGVAFWMALPFVALAGAYSVSVRINTLRSAAVRAPYLVELRTRYLLQYKKDLERLDVDTTAIDAGVENAYQEALRDHPYSALVHVFYAQYLRYYKGSQSLELVQLNVGARKDPPLDLRFLIYQRKKEVEEEELTSAPHRMTVVMRVAAERHEVESHQAMVKAKSQQILFWSQLLDSEPDLAQLHMIGQAISDASENAERHFNQLLRINPQSVSALRNYARFLLEVVNNKEKAEKLIADADELEAQQSRMNAERGDDVVLFSTISNMETRVENIGIVTISNESHNLGRVESMNNYGLRMLNYSQRELVGSSMSLLFPPRLGEEVMAQFRAFLEHGSDEFVNTSKVFFALTHEGYMIPVCVSFKSMDTVFGGLLQPLLSRKHFVMADLETLTILGCSQRSYDLLGVTPDTLRDVGTSLNASHTFPTLEDVLSSDALGTEIELPVRNLGPKFVQEAGSVSVLRCKVTVSHLPRTAVDVVVVQWTVSDRKEGAARGRLKSVTRAIAAGQRAHKKGTGAAAQDTDSPLGRAPPHLESPTVAEDNPLRRSRSTVFTSQRLQDTPRATPSQARDPISSDSGSADVNEEEEGRRKGARSALASVGEYKEDPVAGRLTPRSEGERKDGDDSGQLPPQAEAGAPVAASRTVAFGIGVADDTGNGDDADSLEPVGDRSDGGEEEEEEEGPPRGLGYGGLEPIKRREPRQQEGTLSLKRDLWATTGDATYSQDGSSSSFTSSSYAIMSKLRKAMERLNQTLDPGLEQLMRSFAYIVLLTCALNVGSSLIIQSLNTSYSGKLAVIQRCGERQMLLQRVTMNAQTLVLSGAGVLPSTYFNESRSDLQRYTEQLDRLHKSLYETSRTQQDASYAMYTTPVASVEEKEGSAATTRSLNLLQAGVETVSRARNVIANPALPTLSNSDPDAHFLLSNGPGPLLQAFNQSCLSLRLEAEDDAHTNESVKLAEFLLQVFILDILAITVVVPIVQKIDRSKDNILRIFLDVPKEVLQVLHQRATKQLEVMIDEDGEEDLMFEEDEEEKAILNKGKNSNQSRSGGNREFKKSVKAYLRLLLHFAGPIFAIIIFFAGLFLYGYTTDNSTNGRAVEIYEKAQLRVAANEFLFYVRGYVSGIHLGSDPYNRSMALSDEVLARDRAILFGNDGTGLAGTLQASKRESVLQLEDGCSYDGAVPACSTFYDGILNNGLHEVVNLFLRDGRIALDTASMANSTQRASRASTKAFLAPMHHLYVLDRTYMQESMAYSISALTADTKSELDYFGDVYTTVAILSVIAIGYYYVFHYRPSVHFMDRDMKRTRTMLLLLPEEVISGLERVKQLVKGVTRQLASS